MDIIEEKKFLINLFEFINKVPCKNITSFKYWKEKINYLKNKFWIDDDLINNYNQILIKNGFSSKNKKFLFCKTQWGFIHKIEFILSNHYNF